MDVADYTRELRCVVKAIERRIRLEEDVIFKKYNLVYGREKEIYFY